MFGRFKNESFYNHSFTNYTIPEFIRYMLDYIHWYNNDSFKINLGEMSPVENRLARQA